MNQEPNPQDKPVESAPTDKATEPEPTPAETPWWETQGFNDEATAITSAANAQAKISKLGREKSELLRAQAQAQEPPAQPQEPTVTAESFFDNPAAAIASASETASRRVLQEFQQEQQNTRMIEDAAKANNVDPADLKSMYHDLNNNPQKAVELLGALASAQQGQVQAQDVRNAMEQVAENKSRATGSTGGSHVPEETEPDWEAMTLKEMTSELAKRGMVESQKGGFTVND